MRWYMAANDRAAEVYCDHIKVALKSARRRTELEPRLLFTGPDTHRLAEFEALGAEIVRHDVPFLDRLRAKKRIETRPHFKIEIASGAYLRSSVPLVEDRDDIVLYTDLDVMFLRDVPARAFAESLEAATEGDRSDTSFFNSGVMFMNVPKLRRSYDAFLDYMVANDFNFPAYDQGAYNRFYADDWGVLDERYNWKPYWGRSDDARVLHFHGPKIWSVRDLCAGRASEGTPAHHVELFDMNPAEYRRMLDLFETELHS